MPWDPVDAMPRSVVDIVEARDRTILEFLKDGSASFEAVMAALHEDGDWTVSQKREACALALRRLCLKKLIVKAGDTYMLPQASADDRYRHHA